jgi:hypothetical protein
MWMTESAILLVVSAVLEPLREDPGKMSLVTSSGRNEVIGLTANLLVLGTISWFMWKGNNWARWGAFIICLLCLSEITSLNATQQVGKLISTFYDVGVAIFLLFWLNTKPVRLWFSGKTTAIAPPPGGNLISALATAPLPGVVSHSE